MLWLADLSSRKLLNRVHHAMYNDAAQTADKTSSDPALQASERNRKDIGAYVNVSNELRHQLETWYTYLPQEIRPNLMSSSFSIEEAKLVLRYHAAGDIISRPFVFYACSLAPDAVVPEFVLENCKTCIYHCREYVAVFDTLIGSPSGSLEIFLHS